MPGHLAVLVAHQGGWDEFLLVAAPIVVLAVLLWIANRRANALRDDNADTDEPVEEI